MLPPLPPARTWAKYFPRRIFAFAMNESNRISLNRICLASKTLTDAYVRELGIRPGEVVFEVNSGPGLMTRSLLDAGRGTGEMHLWKAWEESEAARNAEHGAGAAGIGGDEALEYENEGKSDGNEGNQEAGEIEIGNGDKNRGPGRPPKAKSPRTTTKAGSQANLPGSSWPHWPAPIQSTTEPVSLTDGQSESPQLLQPALVVCAEPSSPLSVASYNYNFRDDGKHSYHLNDPSRVVYARQSAYDSNLLVSGSSAYRWGTLVDLLNDPLVRPYLEKMVPESSETNGGTKADADVDAGKRKWDDPEPPITILVHVPDSVLGEQMLAQWIGSAVGGAQGRQWIWQWGRIRLAVVCGKGLYDRLMARPREMVNCKLGVITSALFHRRPLPPHHHVDNIDKSSKRTKRLPDAPPGHVHKPYRDANGRQNPNRGSYHRPAIIDPSEDDWSAVYPWTTTYATDFYPFGGPVNDTSPLVRPKMLGLVLTPKLVSPISPAQKDAWDFVLRNCFIREMRPIADVISILGFGAENLIPKISYGLKKEKKGSEPEQGEVEVEQDSEKHAGPKGIPWKGDPVDPETIVQDLTVMQWARVVDVFDRWAFRPENLMLDSSTHTASRELAVD